MLHNLQLFLSFWIATFLIFWSDLTSAQLVNGQFFTSGLAISNTPAPGSQYSAGSAIGVSVDVSGNGRLPTSASVPGSTLPTSFTSLNIFLVSSQTKTNITVTSGTQFLEGEAGSTVKHLDFAIPSCLKSGDYNYTYYEVSRINGATYFSITPIPIFILNNNNQSGDESCNGSTEPEAQPQPSSPPPEQPFLGAGFSLTTGFSQGVTPTGVQNTVTVTLTQTVVLTISTSITQTQTLTGEGGVSTITTVIPTLLPTTATTVFTTATSGSFVPINSGHKALPSLCSLILFTGSIWLVLIHSM